MSFLSQDGKIKIVLAVLAGWFALGAYGAAEISPARIQEIAAMLSTKPAGLGRPISDRVAWEKIAHTPSFATVIAEATKLAAKPITPMTEALFLDYSRTGNRERGQRVLAERTGRLNAFTLAECLENKGRFIRPLQETVAAICAERTWVYPAHDGGQNNFYGRTVTLDLRSTTLARDLATADFLLGDRLPEVSRRLIRENIQRRILQPFRDMVEGRRPENSWLRATHNWNAVCLCGVTGAALAMEESPADRAWFIAAAEHYIQNFLKGFTPDGYCTEGIGYWNYGYGRFLILGETIRQATGGGVDFLARPEAQAGALFGSRVEIVDGIYPSIGDCSPGSRPEEMFLRFLDERLGLPVSGNRDELFVVPAGVANTALFAFLPEKLPVAQRADRTGDSPLRTWFPDGGVLICRPAPGATTEFAAVLQGGHNAEHHNHNDVGSFSVVAGGVMVLCDPGGEVYTSRTFSSKRYDSEVLNSHGHAVPVVAGKLQRAGREAHAEIRHTNFTAATDTLKLDIRSAYVVPELQKLERAFIFQRAATTSLTVRDEVEFSSAQTFETALITWGEWKKVSANEYIVRDGESAVRVKIDTGGLPFKVRTETLKEDVHTPRQPVRIGIALKSATKQAVVTMTITPEPVKH